MMVHLSNVNIANVLGIVDASDSGAHQQCNAFLQWFIFEHLPLGDLKQFLRRHRLTSTSADVAEPTDNTLT